MNSLRDRVSSEEWRIRIELAALYRWIARLGWDDHIHTHLSARVAAARDEFLLNPLGLLFEEVTASRLIKVDVAGNTLSETEDPVNFGGVIIHGAVYAGMRRAACVIHLHTIPAVAVSAQERGLLPISQFAMLLDGKIAYHDFTGLESSEEDRRRLIHDFGDKKIMMLRSHGTLVWGETVAEAFALCYWLEQACAVQIAAQSGGATLRLASPEVARLTAAQGERFGPTELSWRAVLRRLDALDPSYRD